MTEQHANGTVAEDDFRLAKAAPTVIDLQQDLARLERELTDTRIEARERGEQLDQVRWCFAELVFGLKVAAAQQAMKDPAVQERMLRQMIAEMDGAVAPTSNSQGA